MTPAARLTRARWWPGVLAWGLWLLTMLILVAIPWLDRLLRQAGRPDLAQWDLRPGLAAVSAATVGAVLASRRPRHPVGWLLLAQTASLLATGAAGQYLAWGLLAPGGGLPATRLVALGYPASAGGGLILLGFVLLLTPTGRLPSPRWCWGARVMVVVPAVLLVAVLLAPGPVDPSQVLAGPFDLRGLGGVVLVVSRLALAFTTLAVVACAGSLVVRFRRASGVERQQLRWVAYAAALVVPAAMVGLAGMVLGSSEVLAWAFTAWLVGLPLAIGAAVLRYRLYDLDRIISRALAWGLLTLLLGGGYAAVVLGLGQRLGRDSSLAVAAATLAAAAVFQPARRRVQAAVDRRFNRRRHDAAQKIAAFSDHLRQQVDLDALTAELLAVAEETMQPTRASLWLRPPRPSATAGVTVAQQRR